jgi:hypothetical protein
VGVSFFPKCHESSNTLHRALKCTREFRGGHYEKCNVCSCGHFVFEMWAFLFFPCDMQRVSIGYPEKINIKN